MPEIKAQGIQLNLPVQDVFIPLVENLETCSVKQVQSFGDGIVKHKLKLGACPIRKAVLQFHCLYIDRFKDIPVLPAKYTQPETDDLVKRIPDLVPDLMRSAFDLRTCSCSAPGLPVKRQ